MRGCRDSAAGDEGAAAPENDKSDSIGTYNGSVCGNSDMELGKQAEKGCSVGKRKRNGKRPDRGKKNIMPLRRIWMGEGA